MSRMQTHQIIDLLMKAGENTQARDAVLKHVDYRLGSTYCLGGARFQTVIRADDTLDAYMLEEHCAECTGQRRTFNQETFDREIAMIRLRHAHISTLIDLRTKYQIEKIKREIREHIQVVKNGLKEGYPLNAFCVAALLAWAAHLFTR